MLFLWKNSSSKKECLKEGHRVRSTVTKCISCPWGAIISRNDLGWKIEVMNNSHNHPPMNTISVDRSNRPF